MEPLRPAVLLCPPLGAATSAAGAPGAEAATTGDSDPAWRWPAHDALVAAGMRVLAPGLRAGPPVPLPAEADERLVLAGWVAELAITIGQAGVREPLLLVAAGTAARGLPALGFSQRAARHSVVGYVIVDGAPPPPSRSGQDWPDAPVVAIQSPDALEAAAHSHAARLRGWPVLEGPPAELLVSLARRWPDLPPA